MRPYSECSFSGVSSCDFLGFFFFSSRRRHTRSSSDWSSDVCSSDLDVVLGLVDRAKRREPVVLADRVQLVEIGRASWRERGEMSVVAGSLKKKKRNEAQSRSENEREVRQPGVVRNIEWR